MPAELGANNMAADESSATSDRFIFEWLDNGISVGCWRARSVIDPFKVVGSWLRLT